MRKTQILLLTMFLTMAMTPAVAEAKTYKATPTDQTVTLNGVKVDFAAYNIEGNNYFKLRDLAAAMDGTEKNFNISYNREKDSVEITSLTPYTTGNTGLSGYTKKGNQKATNSPQSIYLDDERVTLQAYSVLDYNYCKLRDVAELLDFAVDWNPNTNTVNIGTDRGKDESITVDKEDIAPPIVQDITTQKAVKDIMAGIGPGTPEYSVLKDCDKKDWEQLQSNPYSSARLSIFFDEYKKYGNLEHFKANVMSWLANGGDDGIAHVEVFG